MTGALARWVATVALATLVAGCGLTNDELTGNRAGPRDTMSASSKSKTATASDDPHEPRSTEVDPKADTLVVAISIDGFNPESLRDLSEQDSSAFDQIMSSGAYTLNARSALEMTLTLPNHTGMLTGRPISLAEGGHGVTVNHSTPMTVEDFAGEYAASVFDVLHDHGYQTGLFASKAKFALFDHTWSKGAPDVAGRDNGVDKIDQFAIIEDNHALVTEVLGRMSEARNGLSFIHLSAPDAAGHAHGWFSSSYLDAVSSTLIHHR